MTNHIGRAGYAGPAGYTSAQKGAIADEYRDARHGTKKDVLARYGVSSGEVRTWGRHFGTRRPMAYSSIPPVPAFSWDNELRLVPDEYQMLAVKKALFGLAARVDLFRFAQAGDCYVVGVSPRERYWITLESPVYVTTEVQSRSYMGAWQRTFHVAGCHLDFYANYAPPDDLRRYYLPTLLHWHDDHPAVWL